MASDEFNTMMRGLQSLADPGLADRLLNPAIHWPSRAKS
jgi:hypothetical protein